MRRSDELRSTSTLAITLELRLAAYNCGAPLTEAEWKAAETDLAASDLVFIIHVTDGENAARIGNALDRHHARHNAVIAFNCMSDLMRRTRMGKLDFGKLMKPRETGDRGGDEESASGIAKNNRHVDERFCEGPELNTWGRHSEASGSSRKNGPVR